MMRKPRDFDAELKALTDRTKQLKAKRVQQLGTLVIACGADALPVETLAGALLATVATQDAATKEAHRKRGAAFFLRSPRRPAPSANSAAPGEPAHDDGAQPADDRPRAT